MTRSKGFPGKCKYANSCSPSFPSYLPSPFPGLFSRKSQLSLTWPADEDLIKWPNNSTWSSSRWSSTEPSDLGQENLRGCCYSCNKGHKDIEKKSCLLQKVDKTTGLHLWAGAQKTLLSTWQEKQFLTHVTTTGEGQGERTTGSVQATSTQSGEST